MFYYTYILRCTSTSDFSSKIFYSVGEESFLEINAYIDKNGRMVKESTTTNYIEKKSDNVDYDDLEVSAGALVVPKQFSLTPFADME